MTIVTFKNSKEETRMVINLTETNLGKAIQDTREELGDGWFVVESNILTNVNSVTMKIK